MQKYIPYFTEPTYDYKSLFLERTFSIKKDIELIYIKGFKSFFDIWESNNQNNKEELLRDILLDYIIKNKYTFNTFSSKELVGSDCKKAHTVNPITINCGLYSKSSYVPEENAIYITLNSFLLFEYAKNIKDLDSFYVQFKKSDIKTMNNEITPKRVKLSIAHELTHWLDDSFHNRFLTDLINLAQDLKKPDILLLKNKNVNLTYFEINAQIHAIKNLKNLSKLKWDKMTLTDMFFEYTSLKEIYSQVLKQGKDVAIIWQKLLISRMAREKLLGKNMKNFVDNTLLLESNFRI
jgi:hypothetical protein